MALHLKKRNTINVKSFIKVHDVLIEPLHYSGDNGNDLSALNFWNFEKLKKHQNNSGL